MRIQRRTVYTVRWQGQRNNNTEFAVGSFRQAIEVAGEQFPSRKISSVSKAYNSIIYVTMTE